MSLMQSIIEDFKELVSFDSVSFHERKTADWLTERLKKLGFTVEEDHAGAIYGGNAGNIYAYLDGEADGEPMVFCAHMDVVEPGCGKKAIVEEDGTIYVHGRNFNSYSVIRCNGENQSTEYIDANTLKLSGMVPKAGDTITVAQIGEDKVTLGICEAYVY